MILSYTDNFYGVFLPDSYEWQQHTEYIENAFIEARANGEKVWSKIYIIIQFLLQYRWLSVTSFLLTM